MKSMGFSGTKAATTAKAAPAAVKPAQAAASPATRRALGRMAQWFNKSIGILGLLAVWSIACASGAISASLLPAPWQVVECGIDMLASGALLTHLWASLQRVLLGFLVAFLLALPMGLVLGSFPRVRRAMDPLIEVLRPVPPIAMIPLSILWFGIGESSKIFIIAWAAFFPIIINVFGGVQQVDPIHIRAAQTLGAGRIQIFYYVILRSAVPNIIIGMRNGFSMAFISLVAAELIASNAGLGFLIQEARYMYKTDEVLLGILVIGLIGYLINKILLRVEKRLTSWR